MRTKVKRRKSPHTLSTSIPIHKPPPTRYAHVLGGVPKNFPNPFIKLPLPIELLNELVPLFEVAPIVRFNGIAIGVLLVLPFITFKFVPLDVLARFPLGPDADKASQPCSATRSIFPHHAWRFLTNMPLGRIPSRRSWSQSRISVGPQSKESWFSVIARKSEGRRRERVIRWPAIMVGERERPRAQCTRTTGVLESGVGKKVGVPLLGEEETERARLAEPALLGEIAETSVDEAPDLSESNESGVAARNEGGFAGELE